jgi:hypothetical protein
MNLRLALNPKAYSKYSQHRHKDPLLRRNEFFANQR